MNTQEKMRQARQLIQEGRYQEARAVLKTVDHPKAQEWVERIDARIVPPKETRFTSAWPWWIAGGIVVMVLLLASFLIGRSSARIYVVRPTNAEVIQPTLTRTRVPIMTAAPTQTPVVIVETVMVVETVVETTGVDPCPVEYIDAILLQLGEQEDSCTAVWTYIEVGNYSAAINSMEICRNNWWGNVYPALAGCSLTASAGVAMGRVYDESLIAMALLEAGYVDLAEQHIENVEIMNAEVDEWLARLSQGAAEMNSEAQSQSTPAPRPSSAPLPPTQTGDCPSTSATCSQLTCDQAYACLRAGNRDLDRDRDGVPCESLCPGG